MKKSPKKGGKKVLAKKSSVVKGKVKPKQKSGDVKESGSIKKKNPSSLIFHTKSVHDVYEEVMLQYDRKTSSQTSNIAFEKLEQSGIVEKQLWPLLLNNVIISYCDNSVHIKEEEEYKSKYAILFAIFINRKANTGSTTAAGNSPLSFVMNHNYELTSEQKKQLQSKWKEKSRNKDFDEDEDEAIHSILGKEAFDVLIYDILSILIPSTASVKNVIDVKTTYLQIECIQFLSQCYTSMDAEIPSSLSKTIFNLVGLPIWEKMNPRRRLMELEKCPPLKLLWQRRQLSNDNVVHFSKKRKLEDHSNKDHNDVNAKHLEKFQTTFIPILVQNFLNTLYKLDDVALEKESDSDDDEVNNENDDEKSKLTNHSSLIIDVSISFLNSILAFFIDLLYLPATRRFLQPYLLSTCYSVHCGLSSFFFNSGQYIIPHKSDARIVETSTTNTHPKHKLFQQLLQIFIDLENFPMDNYSFKPLSNAEIQKQVHSRCHALQQICFKYFLSSGNPNDQGEENERNINHNPKLLNFAYAGVAYACQEHFLMKHLARLETKDLQKLTHITRLVDDDYDNKNTEISSQCSYILNSMSEEKKRSFLLAVLVYNHAIRPSEAITLSQLPLYPSEDVLWDRNVLADGKSFGGDSSINQVLALPKLNTQFLTFGDYLLRSFKLMRLESAYGIRGDIVDAVRRSNPVAHYHYAQENIEENEYYGITEKNNERSVNEDLCTTIFKGWARMALEIKKFQLNKIAKPKLGEAIPAQVLGEIKIDLEPLGTEIRKEWEEVGEFDNLFLITLDANKMTGEQAPFSNEISGRRVSDEEDFTFPLRYGVTAVRGCMVLEIRDEAGTVLTDPTNVLEKDTEDDDGECKPKGTKRIIKVALDPAQYAEDAKKDRVVNFYESFNLVVRRHGRENNFKAVLETIRDLMYTSTQGTVIHRTIPPWLHNILLGFGDPSLATYSSPTMRAYSERTVGVTHPDAALDYGDTFLDKDHLIESFSKYTVIIDGEKQISDEKNTKEKKQERQNYRIRISEKDKLLHASPYPFVKEKVNGNSIRFTPTQVEAVRSGLSPGLTLIVGPPGTGKTDVAVQIIANLYHSFPTQRTVIVTHSNAALNDLFEKVMARGDVDERYLLRLGSGERDLQTSSAHDFTKLGRVAHIFSRREALLEKVQLLSESLGVSGIAERGPNGTPSYTCETAAYFNFHHIQKRIQLFHTNIHESDNEVNTGTFFPFKKYFECGDKDEITRKEAEDKFEAINAVFSELAEYRPLELLRSQRQRADYLLTKQARIVAMTCTHAAIARSHLTKLGFQYDNILMEEAGQMLEVETFVPMLLQSRISEEDSAICRLKRICLIGDHNQLPPVVKNLTFSKYCHYDQSLFSRLIRMGVPSILLNKQGRARSEISKLYSWRYKDLGNLDHVSALPAFQVSNAGFIHNYQMINVEDFEGRGESTPSPYFYQNLGEAEYVVALFQYMVLLGYPAGKISLLSTYNGQKQLLEDIIGQRCAPGTPLAGVRPGAISTVDQYQGQQNDYILLSLVRTSSIGYLRDIRRLIVAVSRARLGLYVFGRQALFKQCHELWGTLRHLHEKPNKLEIITGEYYPSKRKVEDKVPKDKIYEVEDVTDLGSIVFSMQEQLCN